MEKYLNSTIRNGETPADDARLSAVKLVYLVTEEKNFINLTLDSVFERFNLTSLDRSFATAIAYGTLSDIILIDEVIKIKSKVDFEKIDPFTKSILRTGIWQIFMSDKIPDSAACNESVKIAKLEGKGGSASFVNAILRSAVREKEELKEKIFINPKKFYLKCGLPPELAGYFKKWFGEERAISVCQSMRETPLMGIRINKLTSTMEYVEKELDIQECEVFPGEFMENALLIKTSGVPVERIPAFIEGDFTVQDESAMLVSLILSPSPDSVVVDVCSAPGGKTCHMAEIMRNKGIIYALDISSSRLLLVEETARRLKVRIIKTIEADATKPMEIVLNFKSDLFRADSLERKSFQDDFSLSDSSQSDFLRTDLSQNTFSQADSSEEDFSNERFFEADYILADVPCSGLGIMRKKPEIKLNMKHEKIISLYDTQKAILDNASKILRPGGMLVYSTCTLNPEENENRILKFLEENESKFEPVDFSGLLPVKLIEKDPAIAQAAKNGMITLVPDVHGSDGFFIAKIRRKAN